MDRKLINSADCMLDFVTRLHMQNSLSEIARELFATLRQLIPFESATISPIDMHSYEMLPSVGYGCDNTEMMLYLERFAEHPLQLNKGTRLSTIKRPPGSSPAEFEEFRHHTPFEHALCVLSGWRERPLAALGLHRTVKQKAFTNEEIEILNRISAHTAHAIALQQAMTRQDAQFDVGVFVFSGDDRLLFRNDTSYQLMPDTPPDLVLSLAMAGAVWRNNTKTVRLRIQPLRRNSILHWLSLRSEQRRYGTLSSKITGEIKIITAQLFQRRTNLTSRLKRYHLSPREAEVALGVIRGMSNAQIADDLHIDECTVKDHLRKSFEKLAVRSRTSLVSKVLGLDTEHSSDANTHLHTTCAS